MMGIKDFKNYLHTQINAHSNSPKEGIKYILNVLTTICVDLQVLELLIKNKFSNINNNIWPNYFRHVKRCCLIDLWSVTEIRIREIAQERKLRIRGRNEKIRELIIEADNIIKSIEAKKKLKEAKRKLGGKFIEFSTYLSAVLKNSKFNKKEKKERRIFFDIFRVMRNSAHDNFTCGQTKTLRWKRHRIVFKKGEVLNVKLNFLKKIIEELFKFFEAIES